MEFFNKILNSNYLLSSFLFVTSVCLYHYKINYQYIKKLIKNKIEDTYKITNTNDSIDLELMLEFKRHVEKTNINDNFFDSEFDYFYYCYN